MKKAPVLNGKTGRAMPKGKPWKKGQSGNPGGRPKKFSKLISDAIREQLGEIDPKTGMTYASVISGKMLEIIASQLEAGLLTREAIAFWKEAADRTEGRPSQKLEIDDQRGRTADETIDELLDRADARAKSLAE